MPHEYISSEIFLYDIQRKDLGDLFERFAAVVWHRGFFAYCQKDEGLGGVTSVSSISFSLLLSEVSIRGMS